MFFMLSFYVLCFLGLSIKMKKIFDVLITFVSILFIPVFFILYFPVALFKWHKIIKDIKKNKAEYLKKLLIKDHYLN